MTHKLHQILAVETGEKNRATKRTTELYKLIKKTGLFKGFVRTYKPRNDEDIRLPDERTEVQYTVKDVVNSLINEGQAKLWDLTATRDWGNTHARADIVVGDQVLVENAPVPFLLFLEQRLNDLYTFVSNLPVLDKAQKWDYDKDNQLYRSRNPVETIKTQKVQAPLVKYEATPDHPAQTEVITKDVVQGTWTQVDFSGAITDTQRRQWMERINTLRDAVKVAREKANSTEVEQQQVAESLFGYIFG